jgi:UDP-glucose 4-epimerase
MRIAITGCSGYLGGVFAKEFSRAGHEIVKLGRRPEDHVTLDLRSAVPDDAVGKLRGADVLIHSAAAHEVTCAENPAEALQVNVEGSRKVYDLAARSGVPVVAYVSTFHVFGRPNGRLLETTPPTPVNDYGVTHLFGEEYLKMFVRTGKIGRGIILRPANLFGPPASWHSFNRWSLVPFDFPQQLARNGRIVLRSSGIQKRVFTSCRSVTRDLMDLLSGPANVGEVTVRHNCSGMMLNIRDLAFRAIEEWDKHSGTTATLEAPAPERTVDAAWSFESSFESTADDGSELAAHFQGVFAHLKGTEA